MKNIKISAIIGLTVLILASVTACGKKNQVSETVSETIEESPETNDEESEGDVVPEDDAIEDELGDTIDGDVQPANTELEENVEEDIEPEPEVPKRVDLIMFMGQSNMSGCGGDASLAPSVSEEAGMEFRAVSNPTQLYQIVEPFGINENNINGLMEKPGGKKGSLVSSFVNEYYKETGVQVVAVSASLGETDMDKWLSENIMLDVMTRYITARTWLVNNGYEIGHKYVVWLQGESDALKRTSTDAYKTKMDDFIRPLFMDGIEKVFFITPGRTIDETEIYSKIIRAQLEMSKNSGYYGLATSILSGVSCEYMTDIYHYNQHVLNLVGEEAAKSVAYYTNTGHERVIYDYKNKEMFVPDGCEDYFADAIEPIDLKNINERY